MAKGRLVAKLGKIDVAKDEFLFVDRKTNTVRAVKRAGSGKSTKKKR